MSNDVEQDFPELFGAIAQGVSVNYSPAFREFTLPLGGEGRGHSQIFYCPFSGKKMPLSLRDVWFDKIDQLGIFPSNTVFDWDDPAIPAIYHTDKWWKELEAG